MKSEQCSGYHQVKISEVKCGEKVVLSRVGGGGVDGATTTHAVKCLEEEKCKCKCECHTYKGKITNKDKIYVRIRTKFTKKGKITRNL